MIEVKITGADAVQKEVLRLAAEVPERIAAALRTEAELTMTASKQLVPVVTGTLRASGVVQEPVVRGRDISITLGYGGAASAYALVTHENPRAGKTMGMSPSGRRYKRWSRVGQWKYLEQPFLSRVLGLAERIKARVLKEGG